MRAGHLGGDTALLGAGHEMVDQDTQATVWPRAESGHGVGESIDAGNRLDDHSFHAKIVSPDPFDEFGVLDALHPDPRLPGHRRPVWSNR